MSAPGVPEQTDAQAVQQSLDDQHPEDVTPLTRAPRPRPFPTAALGEPLSSMVEAVALATQTDPGIAGPLALGALAAVAGGKVRVRAREGWEEPTNAFVCPAAAPGNRKSAVIQTMFDPVRQAERDLVAKLGPGVVAAATEREVAQRYADAAMAKAGKTNDDGDLADAVTAAQKVAGMATPVMPRLLADDATPEAMTSLLVEQGGRLAVVSAEGGIFGMLAGRYSKVPSLDVVLKGHAGDTMRVDRKGRAPEHVERPALTLVLTVQPAVLAEIGANRDFAGRGLLARLLCCLPPSTVGRRDIAAPPVPPEVQRRYADLVQRLAADLAELQEPVTLQLGVEAEAVLHAAESEHEPRLGPAGDLAPIVEWASKAMGAAVRIAALLHLAEHRRADPAQQITAATMRAALEVMAYFCDHALVVAEVMGADDGLDDARTVLRHARALAAAHPSGTASQRELHRALPASRFPTADAVRAALEVLGEQGWAAQVPAKENASSGGRPASPRWCFRTEHPVKQSTQLTQPPAEPGSVSSGSSVTTTRGLRVV